MAFCRYRSITVQYLRECDINKILPTSFKRWYALRLTPEVRVIFWRPPLESFFFILRSSVRLNPVVIRYCVINLAPFQEITTAFIISKNGCVLARVVLILFANLYFSRLFILLFYLMLYMFRFVFFPRFIVLLFALKRCEPIHPSSASLTCCPRTCVDQCGTLIIACTMLFAPTKCLIYHTCPNACIS